MRCRMTGATRLARWRRNVPVHMQRSRTSMDLAIADSEFRMLAGSNFGAGWSQQKSFKWTLEVPEHVRRNDRLEIIRAELGAEALHRASFCTACLEAEGKLSPMCVFQRARITVMPAPNRILGQWD